MELRKQKDFDDSFWLSNTRKFLVMVARHKCAVKYCWLHEGVMRLIPQHIPRSYRGLKSSASEALSRLNIVKTDSFFCLIIGPGRTVGGLKSSVYAYLRKHPNASLDELIKLFPGLKRGTLQTYQREFKKKRMK